jgi:uncharacterized protein (TIRG00374 family)
VLPSTPPDPPIIAPSAGILFRFWRVARYFFGLAIGGLAVWAIAGKADELRGASAFLDHLIWPWVLLAALAEVVSYLAFAALQQRLLQAGSVDVPMPLITGVTLAATAMQNSLPAGVVLSIGYGYRQYRRFGADEVLAGWALIAMTALSFITLAVLSALGLILAFGTGSALDLAEVIPGVLIAAALIILGWVKRSWIIARAPMVVGAWHRVTGRSNGQPHEQVASALARIQTIDPSHRDWAWATTMALGNWMADLGCLALSFLAVGAPVPWRGLLLAYGAAQLASNLPITPGGLGVVEGSLTLALVAFGGGEAATVGAVLLYRLMSFWFLLPIGWGAWATLALAGRKAEQPATAEGPPVTPVTPVTPLPQGEGG